MPIDLDNKKPKFNNFYNAMPKQNDFENLDEKIIVERQKYLDKCEYIAIDTRFIYQIDVDFYNDKEYNQKDIELVEQLKQIYPFYKSLTKERGVHIFIENSDKLKNKRTQTNINDIEILSGQWSFCKKNYDIFNFDKDMTYMDGEFNLLKKEIKIENCNKSNEVNDKELEEICNNIDMKYLDCYDTWTKIIWCLKNININFEDFARDLSKKSSKYSDKGFKTIWDQGQNSSLTAGTLYYYSKISNEKAYNDIRMKYYDKFEELTLGSDDSLAKLFLKGHLHNLVFINNQIYIYYKNNWVLDVKENIIKKIIRDDLSKIFKQKINLLLSKKLSYEKDKIENIENGINDDGRIKKLEDKIKRYTDILKNILSSSKTNKILDCVKGELSVIDFDHVKFDNKRNLFNFKNKCYDLEKHEFVEIQKEDYILTRLSYNYEECDEEDLQELDDLFNKIFSNKDVKNNFIHYLARSMYGLHTEKFIICNGSGGNGKGVIFELMTKMMDMYAYKANNASLLKPLQGDKDTNIANMNNKRFIYYEEPEALQAKLNAGVIKELTGGCEITARLLFSNDNKTRLIGTHFLLCNKKPLIDGDISNSLYRRIRDIPFNSTFTNNKDDLNNPDLTDVFEANDYYKTEEFTEKYKYVLFEYLTNYIKFYEQTTKNKFYDISKYQDCQIVMDRTNEYLEKSDEVLTWFKENYEQVPGSVSTAKNIYDKFKFSDFYDNLTKKEKREKYNKKNFINELKRHRYLRKFYKDEYYPVINGKKKHIMNCFIGWREIPDEEEF